MNASSFTAKNHTVTCRVEIQPQLREIAVAEALNLGGTDVQDTENGFKVSFPSPAEGSLKALEQICQALDHQARLVRQAPLEKKGDPIENFIKAPLNIHGLVLTPYEGQLAAPSGTLYLPPREMPPYLTELLSCLLPDLTGVRTLLDGGVCLGLGAMAAVKHGVAFSYVFTKMSSFPTVEQILRWNKLTGKVHVLVDHLPHHLRLLDRVVLYLEQPHVREIARKLNRFLKPNSRIYLINSEPLVSSQEVSRLTSQDWLLEDCPSQGAGRIMICRRGY